MTQGRCALCLKEERLQDSHFISKALYRITRRRGGPVVMTPELFIAISDQLRDYLLCSTCEQLFSKNGEDYVVPLVKQDGNSFPLLEKLTGSTPFGKGVNGSAVFSGPAIGIDTEKLAYYALSMFWRASVHIWKTLNQQTTSISLGAYEEPVRRFLHGESGFPDGVVIQVTVCTDGISQDHVFAPTTWSNDMYTGYEMNVFGICFTMVVGVQLGARDFDLCCVNSKNKVIFLADRESTAAPLYRELRANAKIGRNLKKPLSSVKGKRPPS
ncbi:MAG: hypothetical protein WBM11_01290 [Terriglobales bacterium]